MALGTEGSSPRGDRPEGGDGTSPTALVLCGPDAVSTFDAATFAEAGLDVIHVHDPEEARRTCARAMPRVVVLPVRLGATSLIPCVRACKSSANPAVIVIAASDQIDEAAEAMRAGADDCLFAPFSQARLKRLLSTVIAPDFHQVPIAPARAEASAPVASASDSNRFFGMIGGSRDMRELFRRVAAISHVDDPVLIRGEIGSGKSTLARVVHDASSRGAGPFIHIGCDGLEGNANDALFDQPDGPLTRARGGTLFLDRLDDMPPHLQRRLLAALQARERDPGSAPESRIIAALTRPAQEALESGALRVDLYYALNVVELTLPPLRHRSADFGALFTAMLAEAARRDGRPVPDVSGDALDVLRAHNWPGNLRELANCVRGLLLTHAGGRITLAHLPASLRLQQASARLGNAAQGVGALIGQPLAAIERAVIEATIAAEGGSIPRAARILDLSPSTIYRKRDSWDDETP